MRPLVGAARPGEPQEQGHERRHGVGADDAAEDAFREFAHAVTIVRLGNVFVKMPAAER